MPLDSRQAGQQLLRDLRQCCQVAGTCTAGPTNTGCTYCAGAQALTLFRSRVAGCDAPQPIPEVSNASDYDMSRCYAAAATSGAKATAGSRADVRRGDGPIQLNACRNRSYCSGGTIRALDGVPPRRRQRKPQHSLLPAVYSASIPLGKFVFGLAKGVALPSIVQRELQISDTSTGSTVVDFAA